MVRCADSERVRFARLVIIHSPARWLCAARQGSWDNTAVSAVYHSEGWWYARRWPLVSLAGRNAEARLVGIGHTVTRDSGGDSPTVAKCPWGQWLRNGLRLWAYSSSDWASSWYFPILRGGPETPVARPGYRGTFPPLWLLVDRGTWGVFERGSFLWQWRPPTGDGDCTCSPRLWR